MNVAGCVVRRWSVAERAIRCRKTLKRKAIDDALIALDWYFKPGRP